MEDHAGTHTLFEKQHIDFVEHLLLDKFISRIPFKQGDIGDMCRYRFGHFHKAFEFKIWYQKHIYMILDLVLNTKCSRVEVSTVFTKTYLKSLLLKKILKKIVQNFVSIFRASVPPSIQN